MNDENLKGVSIGLNYPIRRSQNGYFDKTFTSIEQIKANITNVLATRRGERIMNPEFGSNLHRIIFEQSTSDIEQAIKSEVETVVGRWLPQVDVIETVVSRDVERNALLIDVTFETAFIPGNKQENLELWFSFSEQ